MRAMTMTGRFGWATAVLTAAALSLAACGAEPGAETEAPADAPVATVPTPTTEASAPAAQGGLALEGEGLRLFSASGSATPIPFGAPQANVLSAVGGALGGAAPQQSDNAECGQGPTQFATYPNGLQLLFQDGRFNGWFLDKAGLTTADGVGVGSTRAALTAARTIEMAEDSTLGAEFSSGDLHGFLTSTATDATVESLWAGGDCFFR